MLIEICEDVISELENDNPKASEILEKVVLAYYYKKHLVKVSFVVVDRIKKSQTIEPNMKKWFLDISKNQSTKGSLYSKISFHVKVTFKESSKKTSNYIILNPGTNIGFELYEETHLLTENLIDSEFFVNIVSYYLRMNKIKCKFNFFSLQGGGNTIQKVYKKEQELMQHFCLAIMDSDVKYPGGRQGDTCKSVIKTEEKNPSFNCCYYVMEKVREIENLIPFHLIKQQSNYKDNQIIRDFLDLDFSFFDMKEGLIPAKLKDDSLYSYWKEQLEGNSIIEKELDKCRKCCLENQPSPKDCKSNCNKKILEGFGDKLLETITDKAKTDLSNIVLNQLTPAQQIEWGNIGRIIFEWCCCT